MPAHYLRPTDLDEALQALAEWRERGLVLAGGTDLLVKMRQGTVHPEAVIDVGAVAELRGVRRDGNRVTVGALTTHSQVEQSAELAAWAPLLRQACREVGSAQIRNRGTLGGNLGNASPAGDTLPALYALDAEVLLLCAGGERWLPVAEFFTGPGQTARQPHELIAAIRFRASEPGERSFFGKIGTRRAMRIAKASAAGAVLLEGCRVRRCCLALGAVAPTVVRASAAEAYLSGRCLSDEAIAEAARLAAQACRPITDIRSTATYRRHVVGVLVARGLQAILAELDRL
jgi:CO/xanthine dehydrogenase FAD-binding subunit